MTTASRGVSPQFTQAKKLLCNLDLAGYARLAGSHSDLELAGFLHEYYTICVGAIRQAGGRVIKYMGDSIFAAFEPADAAAAVAAVVGLRREVSALGERRRMRVDSGCNIHIAEVVEGEYGPEGDTRYDVIGSGVNHLFLMGRGPGLRISEPVYRSLPNDARAAWDKVKPPAVYHFKA